MLEAACRLPFVAFKHVRPPYDALRQLRTLGYDPQVVMRADNNRISSGLSGPGSGWRSCPRPRSTRWTTPSAWSGTSRGSRRARRRRLARHAPSPRSSSRARSRLPGAPRGMRASPQ